MTPERNKEKEEFSSKKKREKEREKGSSTEVCGHEDVTHDRCRSTPSIIRNVIFYLILSLLPNSGQEKKRNKTNWLIKEKMTYQVRFDDDAETIAARADATLTVER